MYSTGQDKYLKKFIKEEHFDNEFVDPVNELNQLITFLESRRVKAVEWLVYLLSGSLGGILGALLTIKYTK